MKALYNLGIYLAKSPIEQSLLNLIYFRVSQINGCAYCLDMHSKDLRVKGETEQRLYVLNAWREAPFYTGRERAALAPRADGGVAGVAGTASGDRRILRARGTRSLGPAIPAADWPRWTSRRQRSLS